MAIANHPEGTEPAGPVRAEVRDDGAVLHLEGVVGVAHARKLREAALEVAAAHGPVALRCEHLQHLDCAAAQVLVALAAQLKSEGTELRVQNLPASVQQTLKVAGLASAF